MKSNNLNCHFIYNSINSTLQKYIFVKTLSFSLSVSVYQQEESIGMLMHSKRAFNTNPTFLYSQITIEGN